MTIGLSSGSTNLNAADACPEIFDESELVEVRIATDLDGEYLPLWIPATLLAAWETGSLVIRPGYGVSVDINTYERVGTIVNGPADHRLGFSFSARLSMFDVFRERFELFSRFPEFTLDPASDPAFDVAGGYEAGVASEHDLFVRQGGEGEFVGVCDQVPSWEGAARRCRFQFMSDDVLVTLKFTRPHLGRFIEIRDRAKRFLACAMRR